MMTTIVICNDLLEDIKQNPEEFVKKIEQGTEGELTVISKNPLRTGLRKINSYGIGCNANGIWVGMSHHNSMPHLYLVQGNMMSGFGDENDHIHSFELRKELLRMAEKEIQKERLRIEMLENKK